MNRHSGSWLSSSWLVSLGSLAAIAVLVLLLWEPWNRRGIAAGKALRFYCAAGMMKPVAEVIREYRQAYGVSVQVDYAGSGELLSRIRATGGQGDLFLAADTATVRQAQADKLVAETIPVAVLRPVLIVRKNKQEELRVEGKAITALQDLLRDDMKVVLANPELASVGQASRDVLAPLGLWRKLEERQRQAGAKVSKVGTVTDVVRIVRTGTDYVGIAWSAVAKEHADLELISTPELETASDHIWIGVLAKSEHPTAALQFARYLTARDKGLVHFQKHYFETVSDADAWSERPKIHLSAGAMLKPGLDDAVKAFAGREGIDLETTYLGCGQLVSMMKAIKSGSATSRFPDAYFACDVSFLEDVAQWFEPAQNVTKNDVVLIVRKGNPSGIKSLADLANVAGKMRIGLAHETKSALGKLTADLAMKENVYEILYGRQAPQKMMYADAAHTLVNQMAGVGGLDAAVVYRSNIMSHSANAAKVDIIELPEGKAIATQPFAIAKDSRHRYLVRRFFDALVAPENSSRFRAAGFQWVFQESK